MPGILASGRRLEELIAWKLKGNHRSRILDLSSERLVNFESYELVGEPVSKHQEKEQVLEPKKKTTQCILPEGGCSSEGLPDYTMC